MNDPMIALGFVSIFHVIGGIVVGSTLRGLRHGFPCGKIFLLFWGVLFGGMPLAIGAELFAKPGETYLFWIEILVLLGAILGGALVPSWVNENFDSTDLYPIGFGGVFLLIGLFVGGISLKTDPFFGLAFGCIFGGVGAAVLFSSLRSLLKR